MVDAFAAELLIPTSVFSTLDSDKVREPLVRIAAQYRASWSLTVRQACVAGFVTRDTANLLKRRNPPEAELKAAIGWKPQPDLNEIRVPPSYLDAVYEAYQRRLVTTSRALEMMRGAVQADGLPDLEEGDSAP